MKATLTGLNYEIQIEESDINPTNTNIKVYKISHQAFTLGPYPVLSIHTNTDNLAQALCNHYSRPPSKRRKGQRDARKDNHKCKQP